ncbi:MAG: hypothetical protein ACON4R_08840 [Akkermansiaceae bacterium]
MADTSHLEAFAKMLPELQRERFLQLAVRFHSVPEDDEFLLILEAIGFYSLILKEVPAELSKLLEGANPIQESQQGLCQLVKQAVSETIPSYEDLKRMTERLENHEIALAQMLRDEMPSKSKAKTGGKLLVFLLVSLALAAGMFISGILAIES